MEPAGKRNKTVYLAQIHKVSIKRHIKVKGKASPDDPALAVYWMKRNYALTRNRFNSVALRRIADKQNHRCPIFFGLLNSYEEDGTEGLILTRKAIKDAATNDPSFYHKSCLGSIRLRTA